MKFRAQQHTSLLLFLIPIISKKVATDLETIRGAKIEEHIQMFIVEITFIPENLSEVLLLTILG